MQRIRETAIVLLLLCLIASILIIVYSLLMWHIFPKVLGMAWLTALALLKGLIINAKHDQAPAALNLEDTRLLKLILLSICSIFLVIIYISYLLKNQQAPAWASFALGLLTLKKALKFLPAY